MECTSGILKGRWRIPKAGVCLHSIDSVDMVWLISCALHNMLLEVDGLDIPEWGGGLGDLESDSVPMAMHYILSLGDPCL